jgi:hypothetical protein
VGTKTSILAFADGEIASLLRDPVAPDPMATQRQVRRLNPGREPVPIAQVGLAECTYPKSGVMFGSVRPGLELYTAGDLMNDYPSSLPRHVLDAADGRRVVVHFMHSVVDWLAFAVWENGTIVRSLSVAPDTGVLEDIGERFAWEEEFWAGAHPVDASGEEPYPLPFHPLELGERALRGLFGFVMEGLPGDPEVEEIDPFAVPMLGFRLTEPEPEPKREPRKRRGLLAKFGLVPGLSGSWLGSSGLGSSG